MIKALTFIVCLVVWASPLRADTIAVIGTGDVGGALGPEFAASGHSVIYGSRNPGSGNVVALVERTGHGARAMKPVDAALKAEIVVLAVPGMLVEEIVTGLEIFPEKSSSIRRIRWSAGMTASWVYWQTDPMPRLSRRPPLATSVRPTLNTVPTMAW